MSSEMDALSDPGSGGWSDGQHSQVPLLSALAPALPRIGQDSPPRSRRSLRNWDSASPAPVPDPAPSSLMVDWFVGCFVVKNPRPHSQVSVLPLTSILELGREFIWRSTKI